VCVAFALRMEGDVIAQARIAYGGMAAIPERARHAEAALTGGRFDAAAADVAAAALAQDFAPITDMRAGSAYRLQVAGNLLRRFEREQRAGTTLRTHSVALA